jgi:amino acid adenylation domain-containing protein
VQYPRDRLIQELFEEQVARTPDAVAVIYESQQLTYQELNERSNRLAHYLRAQTKPEGECVAVCMSRSLEMLVAQLAILKAGGTYVPIDPELPQERQRFMVGDSGSRCVVAMQPAASWLPPDVHWFDVNGAASTIEGEARTNPVGRASHVPAYVMYTSGSTGEPKGVVVPHRAVIRLVINNGYAQIEPGDCVAHCSNPAFDASTLEIWGPLLNGARMLIVSPETVLEAEKFAAVLEQHRVTMLWLTVGLFNQYRQALQSVISGLKYLLVGGDVLDPRTIREVLERSPPQILLNGYGPTESTTFATTHRIESVSEGAKSVPVGRPIANTRIYILDRYLQPVPIGVVGEIHIGGDGVALGYLNRPELTAERFIADPFEADPQARLYKSGDLGRYHADGTIEFLGRNDHQIKIRGFRVELGEIEARLAAHPQVRQAAVIAREDVPGEKRLVAYLTHHGVAPSSEELRGHLKSQLPEYMIPSAYVQLESLPLTSNGKLDRKALPAPELEAFATKVYEAPQGETETTLASIWQELLRVERVGRHDNFFELGGHSLTVVQLLSRIQNYSGVAPRLQQLFELPTLSQQAECIENCLWASRKHTPDVTESERETVEI